MSVLIQDVVGRMSNADKKAYEKGDLMAVLYADDTLLMNVSAKSLERFLFAVSAAGEKYGVSCT